jgi:hypothetical protein
MSTKNLARTVIEGGRYRGNRWFRRYSHKQERTAEQQLSSRVMRMEVDSALYEVRRHEGRAFRDKLGPAERWLRSQVGRPWNKVHGDLMHRFDTRTTAGRHIVFCHLIPSVKVSEIADRYRRFAFRVDRHGILREVPRVRFRHPVLGSPLPERESVLVGWLGARRVGERDTHLFWFVPTAAGAFRQASALDGVDAARWRSLPDWFRERWDALAARVPARRD